MGKKEQTIQGKRFKEVLNNLKENGISTSDITSKIGTTAKKSVDSAKLRQYCETYKAIPVEVIDAFHECYNVNPLFIKGSSESMYDDMKVECELFKKLVRAFSAEKRYYLTPDNQELCKDFLVLEVKHDFYNYLIEVANLQILKKQDEKQYYEKANKLLIKYNKLKEESKTKKISYGKYALLPEDYLLEIADDEEESHYELNPQRYNIHNIPRGNNSNHKD